MGARNRGYSPNDMPAIVKCVIFVIVITESGVKLVKCELIPIFPDFTIGHPLAG